MTTESRERSSRRALLATTLGGLAAATAGMLSRPLSVRGAGQGQALVLGEPNTATGTTSIVVEGPGNPSTGLTARSPAGDGLAGRSGGFEKSGVYGRSDTGGGFGVYGYNSSTEARGWLGGQQGVGAAVGALGTAARFVSTVPNATALATDGRVVMNKVAGVATIPAGGTSVTVTPGIDIVGEPAILLTARRQLGNPLWATSNATQNTITIRTSLPVSAKTKVSYLIIHP